MVSRLLLTLLLESFFLSFRDAWDKCRLMSKDAAMVAYIDEIRKVSELKQSIRL